MKDKVVRVPLKLERIKNTDKEGNEIKDEVGNQTFIQHDAVALSQLLSAVDSKVITVGEYKDLIALNDKSREAVMRDMNAIDLNVGEASLLKKLLSNPQNDRILFTVFHIRTINSVLEQLK